MNEIQVFEDAILATSRAQAVAEVSRKDNPHRHKHQGITWSEGSENIKLLFADMTDDELETLGIERDKLLNHVLERRT
ncbi:hypothetical protein ABZN20_10110 [Methylococcus sp. ANG]|uniref:hypothetical protein n=1 Tax=Methylococcus sp. ANG TaxID=3231903 RepID=UPI00345B2260